ncbi:hypothetical protein ANCCAN_26179 [Ancylostoma caninum]|uniref:Uncharacterized protein n=1 Tax=Ancylostoma caninum TaxID=29170 RepID=A0A368F7K6_ANCCA|nr:hypothetical protein ANCCAN_26179 [Ancylostoma caninum]
MSKQEKNGDFVYEVEVEKYIKAPFVGGLWGPGVVHNAPKTITVPKTCQSSKRHQPGVTYTAMGKDNQYYVMKRSDKLNDQEKRFLNILKGQGQ